MSEALADPPIQPAHPWLSGAQEAIPQRNTAVGAPEKLADARAALDAMLSELVRAGGSDLHITTNIAPTVRVHGNLYAYRPTLIFFFLPRL